MNFFLTVHKWLFSNKKDIGYLPYFLLFYLFFFIGYFFFFPIHGITITYVCVCIVVFLILYFRAFNCINDIELTFYLIGIFIIGAFTSLLHFGGSTFFIYIAGFIVGYKNRKRSIIALSILVCSIVIYSLLTNQHVFYLLMSIIMSIMIGIINIQQAINFQKNRVLKQSQDDIKLIAQSAERERISRDLHDLLGHSLSVITLKSELSAKMLHKNIDKEKIIKELNDIETLSRSTLSQIRDAVKNYNHANIKTEIIHANVGTDAADITLISNIDDIFLSSNIEAEFALIIREAITNVIRHANTKKVWINLVNENKNIVLTISDEGCIEQLNPNTGMINMKSRIEKIGGTFNINLIPQTQLTFTLPSDLINKDSL